GELGERTRRLHRAGAEAGAQGGAGVGAAARGAGVPADQGSGGARALGEAEGGRGRQGRRGGRERPAGGRQAAREGRSVAMSRDLLFEIGVEELPAAYAYSEGGLGGAVPQLARLLESAFADSALKRAQGDIAVHATPRRLAAIVPGISDREPDRDETLTGPAVKAA